MEPFAKEKIEDGVKTYFKRKESGIKFRTNSILRKITNTLSKSKIRIDINLCKKNEADITEESHLLASKAYDLGNIYSILDTKSKRDFVLRLKNLSKTYLFNQFHYSLLATKIKGLDKKEIKKNINNFK